MESSIIGICETMCPLNEIKLRTREGLLHFYERKPSRTGEYIVDESRVVKEFSRSAAGVQSPKPNNLRTKQCLKRTVEYLLWDIITDDRKPFHVAYDFIFDRLRAIRQEIVIQDFDEITTIELIEPMIMFLAYSLYRLVDEPIERFDPKICRQHLQECLKKVLKCYDTLDESSEKNHGDDADVQKAVAHREFIESLYLLFNLGSGESLARALHTPSKFKNSTFKCSFTVALSFWTRNFYKCLSNIMNLPYILCAVASLHVQSIRRELVQSFSVAYHNKLLSVSLEWLKNITFFHSVQELILDLRYYGLSVDTQTKTVNFQRDAFQASKPIIKSRREQFVDVQLKYSIKDMLLLIKI
ncbi:germinal-center associated nuclear protein [Contarinia nasturtii]|uniref:germinal-center associated nuclear protein n=1 Tax=Contarinia nasturtii TaxID=265458 RepID=UPI0012D4B3F9|nr:germinal-center associated nuclear protein [Contarinia nasturtii]